MITPFHAGRQHFHDRFTIAPHIDPRLLTRPSGRPHLKPEIDEMKNNKEIVRINLTPTQKVQIKEHTGKDAESLELKVSELEERIAPRVSP